MISCIVLGAGAGRRLGHHENKMYFRLGDLSVLQRSLLAVDAVPEIDQIILVGAPDESQRLGEELASLSLGKELLIVEGGKTRQESMTKGLQAVDPKAEIVLVHDGARPLASVDLFEAAIAGAKRYGAVVPGLAVTDTVKRIHLQGDDSVVHPQVRETLVRDELVAVQTPQAFCYELLCKAVALAEQEGFSGTDDASLVEALGEAVHIIPGEEGNRKLTRPEDVSYLERSLGIDRETVMNRITEQPIIPRVGLGYDVHRFKEGRPCILGGVQIVSDIGPDGHSDADVLIHALMDALLGAAGLRDIGYYFPPNDDRFEGIASTKLLSQVMELLKEQGYILGNADLMVIAERPKIGPHIESMKAVLCPILDIEADALSIKATTNEKLGAIGRCEGIAAQAMVSIYKGRKL